MQKIAGLLHKDVLLGIKDIFILLELGFAVVMTLVLIFVIPEDVETEATVFVYDETSLVEDFVAQFAAEDAEEVGEFYVDSRAAVVQGMEENRSAIGLVISEGTDRLYSVELLTQPYTPQAMVDYIRVDMEDLLAVLTPSAGVYRPEVYEAVRISALQEGRRDEIPFNQRLVPPVLLMMVGVVGLFAMVSLLGQERGDKTIRALRVSPTGLAAVLTSKHLMLLATGVATFSIIYLPTIGTQGFLPSLGIMALTILIGSSIGAIIGSYFDNPMGAIAWVFLIMIVLGLPAVSLFSPVFSPGWLRIIPSFHTLFALDAAMFPNENAHIIGQSALVLAGFAVVLVPLSGWVFSARTRREA